MTFNFENDSQLQPRMSQPANGEKPFKPNHKNKKSLVHRNEGTLFIFVLKCYVIWSLDGAVQVYPDLLLITHERICMYIYVTLCYTMSVVYDMQHAPEA